MAKYIVLENLSNLNENQYHDTGITASKLNDPEIPAKIWEMMQLYEYGDGSYAQQKKNFLRQGEFMKDFEDSYDGWSGKCTYFSPAYHDLTLSQLRKYFTWRTKARKGDFQPIESPFAYLYLSELLCGIGAETPEETLKKMADFETGFVNSGFADTLLKMHLKNWMFEYAVIHGMQPETVMQHADPQILAHDTYMTILKNPASKNDNEIFLALSFFAEKDLFLSPVVSEGGNRGKHLFAELWRCVSAKYNECGLDFFTECFGQIYTIKWHPLFNALYHDDCADSDKECRIDECRRYFCKNGVWYEEYYEKMMFDKEKFYALLHEGERVFRKYLKIGRTLRKKPDESWATQYAEAVVAADKKAETEAKRPKINIDISGLDKIRSDAALTRESLLTEDEIEEETAAETVPENEENGLLDKIHTEILRNLLKTGSADEYIKAAHLMPSVVADTINATLFDEIGDNILECDGKTLAIIEDYVEEVEKLLQNSKPC
ncbi:TerB N-terminal domain-containing protein [bacterium]|nr:TerB N-terminal domain-containing protein [bacterium]